MPLGAVWGIAAGSEHRGGGRRRVVRRRRRGRRRPTAPPRPSRPPRRHGASRASPRLYNRAVSAPGLFRPPHAGQRAGQDLRAGHARARGAARPAGADGARADLDPDRDRRQGDRDEGDDPGRDAAPEGARARRRREGRPRARAAGDRRRPRGARGLVAPAVGGARRRLPARRRAARRPVALDAQRRDDAEPVEDRAPGRDRRRRRADRLLALQRRVHAPHLRGAAGLLARRLEPDGVPAARGLRLRGQPVQLHRDRRQPQRLAGADGQHGRLEARVDGRALRALHAASCCRRPASPTA